jgi:hypothetical protein
LHVKVLPVATAVAAAVNLTQHAPASIAWLAVAVVALDDTVVVAVAAVMGVAVAVAVAVDAEAVVVVVMAAATEVAMVGAARSVANWF